MRSAYLTSRHFVVRAVRASGYRPLYHTGARCPGCGGRSWIIGRLSAECAHCATALMLAPGEPGLSHPLERAD